MLNRKVIAILHATSHIQDRCATYEKRTSEIHNSAYNLYFERSINGILSEYYYEWNLADFNSIVFNRTYKFAHKKTEFKTKNSSDFITAISNIGFDIWNY